MKIVPIYGTSEQSLGRMSLHSAFPHFLKQGTSTYNGPFSVALSWSSDPQARLFFPFLLIISTFLLSACFGTSKLCLVGGLAQLRNAHLAIERGVLPPSLECFREHSRENRRGSLVSGEKLGIVSMGSTHTPLMHVLPPLLPPLFLPTIPVLNVMKHHWRCDTRPFSPKKRNHLFPGESSITRIKGNGAHSFFFFFTINS